MRSKNDLIEALATLKSGISAIIIIGILSILRYQILAGRKDKSILN